MTELYDGTEETMEDWLEYLRPVEVPTLPQEEEEPQRERVFSPPPTKTIVASFSSSDFIVDFSSSSSPPLSPSPESPSLSSPLSSPLSQNGEVVDQIVGEERERREEEEREEAPPSSPLDLRPSPKGKREALSPSRYSASMFEISEKEMEEREKREEGERKGREEFVVMTAPVPISSSSLSPSSSSSSSSIKKRSISLPPIEGKERIETNSSSSSRVSSPLSQYEQYLKPIENRVQILQEWVPKTHEGYVNVVELLHSHVSSKFMFLLERGKRACNYINNVVYHLRARATVCAETAEKLGNLPKIKEEESDLPWLTSSDFQDTVTSYQACLRSESVQSFQFAQTLNTKADNLEGEGKKMKGIFQGCLAKRIGFEERYKKASQRLKASFQEYEKVVSETAAQVQTAKQTEDTIGVLSDPFVAHLDYVASRAKMNARIMEIPEILTICYDSIRQVEEMRISCVKDTLEKTEKDHSQVCRRLLEGLEREREDILPLQIWRKFLIEKKILEPFQEFCPEDKNWRETQESELRQRTISSFPGLQKFPELCESTEEGSFITLPNNTNGMKLIDERISFPFIVGRVTASKLFDGELNQDQQFLSKNSENRKSLSLSMEGGLQYRCEYIIAIGRVFVEGVFSWAERFFVLTVFGVLHFYEKDHSLDLIDFDEKIHSLSSSSPLSSSSSLELQNPSSSSSPSTSPSTSPSSSPRSQNPSLLLPSDPSSTREKKMIPRIAQAAPLESIPLGQSFVKATNPAQKIFHIIYKTKKLFERNKTYKIQCKTEDQMSNLLAVLRRYLAKA